MSVKNSSRILILNQPSIKQEKSHTAIYLRNYGNLSGGVIKKQIKITPSRSVRSTNGVVGSVGSFRRGIPINENTFKNNNIFANGEDKKNQTFSFSNNSALHSDNNQFTPIISKTNNDNNNNILSTNYTTNNNNSFLNNKPSSNFGVSVNDNQNNNNNLNNNNTINNQNNNNIIFILSLVTRFFQIFNIKIP